MEIKSARSRIPKAAVLAAVLIALCAAALAFVRFHPQTPPARADTAKDWYTIDDGRSWFSDDASKIPPFEHDGKTAYRCRVWTCDDGKTKFVSHLERFDPDAKKKLEKMKSDPARASAEPVMSMLQVKPPLTDQPGWISISSAQAAAIMDPKCPDGNKDRLRPVLPE